jgi:hypothetical protein
LSENFNFVKSTPGSEDSEYESAAEVSYVDQDTGLDADAGLDALINGLSAFQLQTPCPKKPPPTVQFSSPAVMPLHIPLLSSFQVHIKGVYTTAKRL